MDCPEIGLFWDYPEMRNYKNSILFPQLLPITTLVCRAFIYEAVEDFLFKFGMDGKACLLRAICETHESPLIGYGLFGEFIDLFLS